MKKRLFYVMLAFILLLSLNLIMAAPTAASTLEVGSGKPYATIAAAVTAATDGDTIEVYDGTYYEHVVINKELTITAAAGNSPVVNGIGIGTCFGIYKAGGLSNVTIDGFEIQNAEYGIWMYGAAPSPLTTYSNITITNNNIHDLILNTWKGSGIYITDATVNNLTVSGNRIDSCDAGIGVANKSIIDTMLIDDTVLTNNNMGLALIDDTFSNVTVSNCYFEGNAWEHLDLGTFGAWPSLSNISISGCQFLPGPWCGVYVQSYFANYDVVLRYNQFNVGYCGIGNVSTNIVDAEYNWWGDVSGPYDDKDLDGLGLLNTSGLGDPVGATLWLGDVDYVDYEPWLGQGGFVTGGGWIDSPPGAYMPGPTNINGTFTGVPTTEDPSIACDPNNIPVTFSGWVDVTGMEPNGAVVIGLVDQGLYNPDPSSWSDWFSGAYLYLGRIGTNVRVGPTDGFYGGEINQVGANVPYVDGGPNLINFSMTIYNGEITVTYGGNDYIDTYGEIEAYNMNDAYPGGEFDTGAYVGLATWPETNSVTYDIDISGCTCTGPTGKATFGFVSKYKKGANVPDGNTNFVFKAADLNFHSTSYDWLVVTGSDYAEFKGIGTVNGEGEYKLQIWAGDGTGTDGADTLRIKIWDDDGVLYDNGMDQAIGGGQIVVHTKNK